MNVILRFIFPCSLTSIECIYPTKLVLHAWAKQPIAKIILKIKPSWASLSLSEVRVCWFLTWIHRSSQLCSLSTPHMMVMRHSHHRSAPAQAPTANKKRKMLGCPMTCKYAGRGMWVLYVGSFSMFSNFYLEYSPNKTYVASMSKSTMNQSSKSDWRIEPSPVLLSFIGGARLLIPFMNAKVLSSVFPLKGGLVDKVWRHSPISFQLVASWCLFFDPLLNHTTIQI